MKTQAVKQNTKPHCLKIEDLEMTKETADEIEIILHNFLTDLGYKQERIEPLECRRRDGFIPHSHNKGGLEANAFNLQDSVLGTGGTGFKNADATLEEYQKYNEEWFREDKGIDKDAELTEEQRDQFFDYCIEDTESDVLFSADLMLTSENELNIRLTICVKDAPYHRRYDDLLEYNIKFRTVNSLKNKLAKLLKDQDVRRFAQNLWDAF